MGSATPDERQLLSRLAAGDPSVNGHIVMRCLTPTIRRLNTFPP
jgi:hypothetical protein